MRPFGDTRSYLDGCCAVANAAPKLTSRRNKTTVLTIKLVSAIIHRISDKRTRAWSLSANQHERAQLSLPHGQEGGLAPALRFDGSYRVLTETVGQVSGGKPTFPT